MEMCMQCGPEGLCSDCQDRQEQELSELRGLVDELLSHIRSKPNFSGFTCNILQRMADIRKESS